MITNDGKVWLKKFLIGGGRALATSMAVGVGSSAESLASTKLDFEVARVNLDIISYDFVGDKLVFKATLPTELEAVIYEIGLFTLPSNALAYGYGSRLLVDYAPVESWANATWNTSTKRLGTESMITSLAANGSSTATLSQTMNLSGYSSVDKFIFAFQLADANTSSIRYRFLTDASNYYEFLINTGLTAGYKIFELAKSSATTTGSPNWSNINQIQITTSAKSSGATVVYHDGIRVEDTDTVNVNYLMFSRKMLSTPIVKQAGIPKEIEYGVPITI